MANIFDQFDQVDAAPPPAAGTNIFDQFDEKPVEGAAAPSSSGSPLRVEIRPNAKGATGAGGSGWDGSYGQNLGRQAMQGATFGFADEMGAGLGALKALLTDDEYGDLYNKILERNRSQDKGFSEENPIAATTAQIAGGLATAPFTPALQAARGAGLGARMATGGATAAGYGALYGAGAGEGIEDRAAGAATGLVAGGVLGGAVPALGAGLRAAGGALAAPFRGAIGADREAARRVGQAFATDGVDIASAQRSMQMGQAEGIPIVAGDAGGEMVRGVARSAANSSSDARRALGTVTEDRWLGQGGRTLRLVRAITGAGEDTEGVLLNLERQARAANAPAYQRAYSAPAAQAVWTPELQQLATSPTFVQAMRRAETIGRDDAALNGFQPLVQPFDFTNGVATLRPGAVPNLQFWDYVHRGLRRTQEAAQRQSPDRARQVGDLDRALRDHLDVIVPEFGQARAGAAAFFRADDAGEVGRNLARGLDMERAAVQRGFRAMNPAERSFARETFANELMRQIRDTRDRVNVTNQIFENQQMRDRIEIVLGEGVARRMEALVRVENMMNTFKNAVSGNSSTARQLAEYGLAGGIGTGYGLQSGDWTMAAALGAAIKGGSRYVDTRVARRVGEMLASDDPQVLDQAARMVARNATLMAAIRSAEAQVARSLAPVHPDVAARNVVGGAADESDRPGDDLRR